MNMRCQMEDVRCQMLEALDVRCQMLGALDVRREVLDGFDFPVSRLTSVISRPRPGEAQQ